MTQTLGWILVIATLICFFSPFLVWWKLRKIRSLLGQLNSNSKNDMPLVTFFGSYRKGLSWVRKNQQELPEQLSASAKQALIIDKLGIYALGFLFAIAAISMIIKP